jgi:diguanylate cyclase (GGDEF)-like protein
VLPILCLVAALAATALAMAWASVGEASPGRGAFIAGLFGSFWWTATTLAQVLAPLPSTKIFASQLAWFGISLVPLGWFFSVMARIGLLPGDCPWARRVVFAISAAVTGVALTNDWHGAIYTGFTYVTDAADTEVIYHHGWLFWILMVVFHAALGAGVVAALWAARGNAAVFRWQFVGLVIAMLLPWLLNLNGLATGFALWRVDPAPFAFSVTGLILTAVIHKGDLFRLAPIAHRVVLEVLPDPVLVIDARRRILEVNPAAVQVLGLGQRAIGRVLDRPASLIRHLDGLGAGAHRADVEAPEIGRVFDVMSEPLDNRGRPGSRLLVMRDITLRAAAEARLEAARSALSERLEQNIDLQRRLREEAQQDHLTGLYNRRHAHTIVPEMIAAAATSGRALAVAVIDIDHFKQFNDRFGHAAGDDVLVAFARVLREGQRRGETAFRYGGEEFLVVLPGADRAEAVERCARWRERMAGTAIASAPGCRVTFSAGVALLRDLAGGDALGPSAMLERLVRAADVALYGAKITGRDRTVVWGEHLAGLVDVPGVLAS